MKYWIIAANDVAIDENGLQNVVKKVHWRRRYIFEKNMTDECGVVDLPSPDSGVFKNYESLTYEEYCTWLESILDVQEIDTKLEASMDKWLNPPVVPSALPFDNIAMDNYYQNLAGIDTTPKPFMI